MGRAIRQKLSAGEFAAQPAALAGMAQASQSAAQTARADQKVLRRRRLRFQPAAGAGGAEQGPQAAPGEKEGKQRAKPGAHDPGAGLLGRK